MQRPNFHHIFFVFTISLIFPVIATATPVTTINIGNDNRIFAQLQSIKTMRDQGVVKQGYDYSCGSGALATLLTYYFNDPVSEEVVLQQILEPLNKNQEKLREKQGLTLTDLKNAAESRGYKTKGMKLLPKYLLELKAPVIVFIKPRGHEHFAVFKGVRADRVYLADPSLGNVRMPIYQFLDMWVNQGDKGIIFVVERRDGQLTSDSLLKPPANGLAQPEILTIRQMLEVGNPYIRFPLLSP
jgi:hypothetical protein